MTIAIYLVGILVTLLIFVAAIVYAEENGKCEISENVDSLWVFFLAIFWPIVWALFLLEIFLDLLKWCIRQVFKIFKKES